MKTIPKKQDCSTLINKIINADCIDAMKTISEDSVDVIFADPPYFLQLNKDLYRPNNTKVLGVDAEWDKFSSFEEYDEFTSRWLLEAKRVLKKDGTIWVMGSYHNIFRIGKIMQDLDFWVLNDIIWKKSNPMPNFKGVRFSNGHETIIWAKIKSKDSKYYFNYDGMKIFNDDKQMTSVWETPICSGKERVKENGVKAHPTQKPLALLKRIILSSTQCNDLILDPFFGTGTTGVAAKLLGRNFLGIEVDPNYVKIAQSRINETSLEKREELVNGIVKKKLPRVSLADLIEAKFLSVGDEIFDKNKKHKAKVCIDGSLLFKNERLSIHKLASKLEGKKVNGWAFWYYNKNNITSIDDLRQKYFFNK